ncbi:MAG: hypothetical protein R3F59_11260 [Myxococcota bacterium]
MMAWLALALSVAWADPGAFDATAAAPSASTGSGVGIGAIPPEVLAAVESVRGQPLGDRMTAISGALLGRPYVSDPMGEGVPPDADPFARYDAFDCLTYAERSWR